MKWEADVTTMYGVFEMCNVRLWKGIYIQVIQGLRWQDVNGQKYQEKKIISQQSCIPGEATELF